MELELLEAGHRMEMERDAAVHRELMDTRLWYTHMASVAVNALSLVVLAAIAANWVRMLWCQR